MAATCNSKANVEVHDDVMNQDTGEDAQRAADNTEGQSMGEHSSPAVTDVAAPKARTEKGFTACNASGSKFQDEVRGLGAWSVMDWKSRKKLFGQWINATGRGGPTPRVEDGWTAAGNAKQLRRQRWKNDREGGGHVTGNVNSKKKQAATNNYVGPSKGDDVRGSTRPEHVLHEDVDRGSDGDGLNIIGRKLNSGADGTQGHVNCEAEENMHSLMVIDDSDGRELLESNLGRCEGTQWPAAQGELDCSALHNILIVALEAPTADLTMTSSS